MKTFLVSEKEAGQRADKFVRKYLREAPLDFIYRLFRKKDVKVDGRPVRPGRIIEAGEEIALYVSDEKLGSLAGPRPLEKREFPYPIAYEDEGVLIVAKPRGLLIHGASGGKSRNLAEDVLSYLYLKGDYDPEKPGFAPSPAHRLDRNTSGLVVFAKTLPARQALEELFKGHQLIRKSYLALVLGNIDKKLVIEAPLRKDERTRLVKVEGEGEGAKAAKTIVVPKERLGDCTLVEAVPVTGKTHQIRVHLAYIKHPVVGDAKYGDFKANRIFKAKYGFFNQFLHAGKLVFGNIDGPLAGLSGKTIECPLPEEEEKIIRDLRAHPLEK